MIRGNSRSNPEIGLYMTVDFTSPLWLLCPLMLKSVSTYPRSWTDLYTSILAHHKSHMVQDMVVSSLGYCLAYMNCGKWSYQGPGSCRHRQRRGKFIAGTTSSVHVLCQSSSKVESLIFHPSLVVVGLGIMLALSISKSCEILHLETAEPVQMPNFPLVTFFNEIGCSQSSFTQSYSMVAYA